MVFLSAWNVKKPFFKHPKLVGKHGQLAQYTLKPVLYKASVFLMNGTKSLSRSVYISVIIIVLCHNIFLIK